MKISAFKIFLIIALGILIAVAIALYALKKGGSSATKGARETAIQSATELNHGQKPPVSQDSIRSYLLVRKDGYLITFHDNTQSFLITVYGSPFERARIAAEQEFLSLTKLTTTSACGVRVDIVTPASANPNEADRTFKLSFCPPSS